ncbi:hypothetical protein J4E90_009873 [Alternaria incomplexa]|uniref:uncharacterized protein n=1 Tax=Alternaria incomplexa TaxID=1187928 RepID=UPI0022206FAE|nr:uncharacterized protein J4E90_009873 [Alternaria incomplexa]KAI4906980.1 hypothetical protein J4E90_009873 [Alternaria incomplexa]
MSKLLKLIPEGETPENRALHLTRREASKKALRAHQEHVRLGVEAEIQTVEDALEDLSAKDGVTQVELQGARDELASLRGHREGIIPTTCNVVRTITDAGEKGIMYCALSEDEQVAFWDARWTEDVFVSYLWEFSGSCTLDAAVELGRAEAALETVPTLRDGITQVEWDDAVLRSTYSKRFVWLADLVSQYILPLKATAVCLSSATKSLVRSSLDFPDNKALAYAEFKRADSILYPPEHVPEERNTAYAEYRRADKDLDIVAGDFQTL